MVHKAVVEQYRDAVPKALTRNAHLGATTRTATAGPVDHAYGDTSRDGTTVTTSPLPVEGQGGDVPAGDTLPDLPEPLGYRVKTRVLGPALHGDVSEEPELGVPTALAVFSSDCISSSAYATEEILAVLIPVVGIYAFGLVVPITVAILVMLTFLIVSYRQTIRTYPAAGGAYLVSRENFGYRAALVAGLSLLIGYILTVAVSTSAGVAALTSVFPAIRPWSVELTVAVIVVVAWLNLRGAKESGRIFMVPTYLFIAAMCLMIVIGVVRGVLDGGLAHVPLEAGMVADLMSVPHGTDGVADAVMKGAGLWVIMGAFATGSSALTGVEAISNGVTTFHPPRWRNAQRTLVIMGVILAILFLGLSALAGEVHAAPFASGSPTVISQVGEVVFGDSLVGHLLYFFFQLTTLLVLFLGANTSFAGFPRLAGFAATDAYLPRQLMKRGHRLVFSNGILLLAGCAIVLVVLSGASVTKLIPFYGIGVFTSFTMSQAGMARHHLRTRERHWQRGLAVNGGGALMTLTVTVIFLFKFFDDGVWVLLILVPVMVAVLVRMNRQYLGEETELAEEAAELADRRILPRLSVLVMVDEVDRATARALRYSRSLQPTEIRAVHLAIDNGHADHLARQWTMLGLGRIPLEIVECPDRRVANGALKVAAAEVRRGGREVTVVIPRVQYRRVWHRILHDRTANDIAEAVADLPRVNVTFVPYHLRTGRTLDHRNIADLVGEPPSGTAPAGTVPPGGGPPGAAAGPLENPRPEASQGFRRSDVAVRTRICDAGFRDRVALDGHVDSLRIQPRSGAMTLELTLNDGTGSIRVVFLGRRRIAGITQGTSLHVAGMVGRHHGHLALLNPRYRIIGGGPFE